MTQAVNDNQYLEKFLKSLRSYCDYHERTMMEVQQKLSTYKLSVNHIENIIKQLIKEDYINEERYAKNFVTSKLHLNKWGKRKIIYALHQKQIPEIYIEMGLNEIDEDEYIKVIKDLIKKKRKESKEPDNFKFQYKVFSYLNSKGFESDIIWRVINYNH